MLPVTLLGVMVMIKVTMIMFLKAFITGTKIKETTQMGLDPEIIYSRPWNAQTSNMVAFDYILKISETDESVQ